MEPQVKPTHYFSKKYLSLERFISYWYQVEAVRESGAESLLFIGVGDGMVPDTLKKNEALKVTTVDIDPLLAPDYVADIRELPFKDEEFDLVCAFEVLEHLPFEESRRALAEIARVSKQKAVISVPHRRTGFELVLKFPFVRTLVSNPYVRIALRLPVRFPGFAVSKQHYWEIDGYTTSLRTFRRTLREHFHIQKESTPVLDFYHRFFVLKKKSSP